MEVISLGLLGGLLALDGTSVGQFMVSRPLVAGTLVGWVLGDPSLGLAVGATLELYLLVAFPVGGSRFPEGSTAAVVAVGSCAGLDVVTPIAGAVPLGVAVGLVWGQVGGASITLLRRLNGSIVPRIRADGSGAWGVVGVHLTAVLLDYLRGAVVCFGGIVVGRALVHAVGPSWPLPAPDSRGLLMVGAAVSVGILLRDFGGYRRSHKLLAAGLVLGTAGAWLL